MIYEKLQRFIFCKIQHNFEEIFVYFLRGDAVSAYSELVMMQHQRLTDAVTAKMM